MTAADRVKVTHTLSRATRDRLRALVAAGEVKDASAFIEQALQAALHDRKMRQLALELEAFDDPAQAAALALARFGDEGMEDIQQVLGRG